MLEIHLLKVLFETNIVSNNSPKASTKVKYMYNVYCPISPFLVQIKCIFNENFIFGFWYLSFVVYKSYINLNF